MTTPWQSLLRLIRRAQPRPAEGEDARDTLREALADAVRTAAARSNPLIGLAIFGLGGASLVAAAVNYLLTLDAYARTGNYAGASFNNTVTQIVAQGALGATVFMVARAAILWVALQPAGAHPTARAALGEGLRAFVPQVTAALIYGLLLSAAAAMVTLFLREVRLDLSNVGRVSTDPAQMARALAARALNALLPDPGPPFSDLHGYVRLMLRRGGGTYASWSEPGRNFDTLEIGFWLSATCGVALAFLADSLLRFRHVAAIGIPARASVGAQIALLRWSVDRFWRISARVWAYRGLILVFTLAFVILPVTVAQGLAVPALAASFPPELLPFPTTSLLLTLGGAPVAALLNGFGLVFDARLWLAMRETRPESG